MVTSMTGTAIARRRAMAIETNRVVAVETLSGSRGRGQRGLHQQPPWIAQSILKQKSTKVGKGTPLLFRSGEKRFMHLVAQRDRNPSGLTLQNAYPVIHVVRMERRKN